jgi:Uma2 family endonuclease
MTAGVTAPPLTVADLLAMPEDGVERWLIRGQLREKPMTRRNRFHSRIEARIAQLLGEWLDRQPEPRGEVLAGEAGCLLSRNPDTGVGIDVVYISPEMASRNPGDTTMIDGPPVLAVEILSPNDVLQEIDEKVEALLGAGVALVWVVDPRFRTVRVHRPGGEPEMVNVLQELSAEPHLPGFRVPAARLFGRS